MHPILESNSLSYMLNAFCLPSIFKTLPPRVWEREVGEPYKLSSESGDSIYSYPSNIHTCIPSIWGSRMIMNTLMYNYSNFNL